MKAYLQDGSTMNNSVSVTGNYDKGSFRLSFSNMSNKGVMPNTKTDQKGVTLNSEYKLTDKLKVSANANYIMTFLAKQGEHHRFKQCTQCPAI